MYYGVHYNHKNKEWPVDFGRLPCIGLLNNTFAGLRCSSPMGVDLICKKVRFKSLLVSMHVFMVLYEFDSCFCLAITVVIYDHDMFCSMLGFWQNVLNLSEIKLVPA